MKRSQRLFNQSRQAGWLAALVLMASVAIVCWVPVAVLSGGHHPGRLVLAVAMGALALLGFFMAWLFAEESFRLARLANRECRYEWEREVRPRL